MNWFDSAHRLLMVDSFSREWQHGVSQARTVTVLVVSGCRGISRTRICHSQYNLTLHICRRTAISFSCAFSCLHPAPWGLGLPPSLDLPLPPCPHACVGPRLPSAQGYWWGGPGSISTPVRACLWAQEGQSQVQAPWHLGQSPLHALGLGC